ncbi:Uncharacterized protein YnzC, UPF0291/DUF896 family [Clostridium collagenovorans DSM 3089]|uniref:UPF0291 protein SAMN02745196_01893 n=1 Tax=Clostridium collagenovorans DSM 3089 TaxID=1121306 RepID=A0A1M5WV05_9CLOT|nr:DUF896 domain-containing protein [Clostridium collagenovorans]SHH91399.1 Uncharacterized protein YnzC, UPF0291/DUF896 family [Clostridium collagenovorans DSM 3089]
MEKDFNKVLQRINFLYKKSQEEGLTEEEKVEQKELREYYLEVFRNNVRAQLQHVKKVDNKGKKSYN